MKKAAQPPHPPPPKPGRRIIQRLIAVEAASFVLLILFISFDDEFLLPRMIGKDFPISPGGAALALDSIWIAGLLALALYIQLHNLRKIRLLEGMLCVCANCKKIRDGNDQWSPMEDFIQKRTYADFTHSICPDCGVKLYGDLYLKAMAGKPAAPPA